MMRIFALSLFLLLLPLSAGAQLGRLFFSDGERRTLDIARERAGRIDGGDYVSPSIDGMVSRSDGKNTIWINGKPHTANDRQVNRASALSPEVEMRVRVIAQERFDAIVRRSHRKQSTKTSN